ncbi:Gfo/Idh/MocA family protein [Chloroflexota bacterium]
MVRIGVIGAGKWGQNHLRVFSEVPCDLIGFADIDASKVGLTGKYHIEYKQDYHELLSLVDAVSIATPANTHYQVAMDCLGMGKHVLVEKPLALDSQDGEQLVALAKKRGLVLAVGYLFRLNPAVIKLKEELKNAGRIHYMMLRYVHSDKPPRRDSGAIFECASHLFDILTFILRKMPHYIFCKAIKHLSQQREDGALILLDYGDFVASLEAGWFHPLKKRDAWIMASQQTMHVDFLEQSIRRYPIEISLDKVVKGEVFDVEIDRKEPLREEISHFIQCIESGKKPINDGESGWMVTRLCQFALESAEKGKELTL